MGLLITSDKVKNTFDRTLWYTIDYNKLAELLYGERNKLSVPPGQIEHIEVLKLSTSSIRRVSTSTYTNITSNTTLTRARISKDSVLPDSGGDIDNNGIFH